MAHYKSDNQMRGNRYDGKYVKGPYYLGAILDLNFSSVYHILTLDLI